MTNIPWWSTVLSSVIVASLTVIATVTYNRWAESRRIRLECLREMCRYSLSENEFFKAFNEVPIVFSKSPKVVEAHQKTIDDMKVQASIASDELPRLLRAMADDLGIKGVSNSQLNQRLSGPKD
jgi:peroxiredoxin